MFSVSNLYLVPTINGDVKYQPKAQARSLIRNDELEAGKALVLVLRPELRRGEFKNHSHQLAVDNS